MEKNGKFTVEEFGIEAYRAWRETLLIVDPEREVNEWVGLAENTREGWCQAANKFAIEASRGRLEKQSWFHVANLMYSWLRGAGAFVRPPGEAVPPWSEASGVEQFASQMVARHLVDCIQLDDEEDTDDALRDLMERVPQFVERFSQQQLLN